MASQEPQERKVLRVDDPTAEETPTPRVVPSTRSEVEKTIGDAPPNPNAPEQKFSASYERMQEVQAEAAEEIKAAHQAAMVAATASPEHAVVNPIPQPVRASEAPTQQLQSDLSLLVTTGLIREETVVGGFKFVLRTLTTAENNEVLAAVASVDDDLGKLGVLRVAVLARAIETVNGVPLENVPGGDPNVTGLAKRENLLGLFQLQMVTNLFQVYSDMLERSEQVFSNAVEKDDLLKN